MEYRTLGRTGLRVSEIGLGGEWFNGLTAQESSAIVDAAQEKGINYIDILCLRPLPAAIWGSLWRGAGSSLSFRAICAPYLRMGNIPVPGT